MFSWVVLTVDVMKYLIFAEAMFELRRFISRRYQLTSQSTSKSKRTDRPSKKDPPQSSPPSESISRTVVMKAANVADDGWDNVQEANQLITVSSATGQLDPINRVLFFPDTSIVDPSNLTHSARNAFETRSTGSFKALVGILRTTRHTLDIALYVLPLRVLLDLIVQLRTSGVKVRLIVDGKDLVQIKGQLNYLKKRGLQIRTNRTSDTYADKKVAQNLYAVGHSQILMHHKFAIIDNRILLNGSFNWTRSAIILNHENLLVTSDAGLLQIFKNQFENMWSKFIEVSAI